MFKSGVYKYIPIRLLNTQNNTFHLYLGRSFIGSECSLLCVQHITRYTAVQYCTLLYTAVHYCTLLYCCKLPYTTVHCCTLLYTAVHCCTLLYTTVHCCTLLYTTVHYCTLLYTAVHYCTVLYIVQCLSLSISAALVHVPTLLFQANLYACMANVGVLRLLLDIFKSK